MVETLGKVGIGDETNESIGVLTFWLNTDLFYIFPDKNNSEFHLRKGKIKTNLFFMLNGIGYTSLFILLYLFGGLVKNTQILLLIQLVKHLVHYIKLEA
jgi:hypothetical protein